MQAEADANRKCARHDSEVRHIEPGVGDGHEDREADARIADCQIDRVRDAGIDPILIQESLAQPALEHPCQEQERDEHHDADQDPDQGDTELADLETEEQGFCPVAYILAGKAPLQHEQRQRDKNQDENRRCFAQLDDLHLARALDAEPSFENGTNDACRIVPAPRHRANAEIEQPGNSENRARQDDLLRNVAAERHIPDCGACDDDGGQHQQRNLDPERSEELARVGIHPVEVVHGAQRPRLRDDRPEYEHQQQSGRGQVRDEALRDRNDQWHVDGAAEFDENGINDIDRKYGFDDQKHIRGRVVIDRDQPPFRPVWLKGHSRERRAGDVDHCAGKRHVRRTLPGREKHVEAVEPDKEQGACCHRRQHSGRRHDGRGTDPIEEVRNALDVAASCRDPATDRGCNEIPGRDRCDDHAQQRQRLRPAALHPVRTVVLGAAYDARHTFGNFVPYVRQERTGTALEQVSREDLVAHHGDAIDHLLGAYPCEFRRLDRTIECRCQRVETRALGGNRGRFRLILRRRPQALDLPLDLGQLRS